MQRADRLALRRELADNRDVVALLAERETFLQDLYPQRSRLRRTLELSADEVALFGLRQDGRLVGCGSLLSHPSFMELKKLFVTKAVRGGGLGRRLVVGIEAEAKAAGCADLKLEVGVRQEAAIGLYRALGYLETDPFPPYRADPVSRFMAKRLAG